MPEDIYWQKYVQRFRVLPANLDPPKQVPAMVVCIPVYGEPNLLTTLESLAQCDKPDEQVEVILLFNKSDRMTPGEVRVHDQAWQDVQEWIIHKHDGTLQYLPIYIDPPPDPRGGVGWARKLVLDEAAIRLPQDGVLLCLDSDCTVNQGYLKAVLDFFRKHPSCGAASLHFEHKLEGLGETARAAIVQYELHLRYLAHLNLWVGHPYAGHTVGSAMAVRRSAYLSHGGMNTRQAGEDFYFLQKFIETGVWKMIPDAVVYPSARVSHRVPFGTGRAMTKLMETGQPWMTTDTIIFEHIIPLFQKLDQIFQCLKAGQENSSIPLFESLNLHPNVVDFLETINFLEKCREIASHTSSLDAFRKRFFRFFNAFMMIRYSHALTRQAYPEIPVTQAAMDLAFRLNIFVDDGVDAEKLLDIYRKMDLQHAVQLR